MSDNYTVLTKEQREEIINLYTKHDKTRVELAKKFDISISTCNRILVGLKQGKSEDVVEVKKPRTRKGLYNVDEIVSKWNSGLYSSKTELATEMHIPYKSLCNIIYKNQSNSTEESGTESIQESTDISTPVVEEIAAEKNTKKGKKYNMGKRYDKRNKKHKKSYNSHQLSKMAPKYDIIESLEDDLADEAVELVFVDEDEVVDEVVEIVEETSDTRIQNTRVDLSSISQEIVPLKASNLIIEVGLVSDRHNMPVTDYIYDTLTSDEMFDFNWQEEQCTRYIDDNFTFDENHNAKETMVLYCTGIQSCLGSVIKCCTKCRVNLVLKHYNGTDRVYAEQVILDMFGEISDTSDPFKNLKKNGQIYSYKSTMQELVQAGEVYGLSVNVHDEYKTFIDRQYIFTTSISNAWEIYTSIVSDIQDNESTRMSVFLTKCELTQTEFRWLNNISKSYNFN